MSSAATATSTPGVTQLTTLAQHDALRASCASSGRTLVLLFTAAWHPPCAAMHTVCETLAKQYPHVAFAACDAEAVTDVTEQYEAQVESVPTTVLVKGNAIVGTLQGANAQELTTLVTKHNRVGEPVIATVAPAASTATAAAPTTAAAVPAESKAELDARLAKLVRASPVMAFIKGTPDAPRCGFTKKLLALMKEQNIQFGSFDILTDPIVREGLKAFSNWPTYPQLYIDGELVGGLDVVTELAASGELAGMVPPGHIAGPEAPVEQDLTARLKSLINSHRIMLFMKGNPQEPKCGFSNKAVALLAQCGCAPNEYGSFDVFSDETVREGIKTYSNWPTFPQLYVDGELIGGLDVMQEMHEAGELQSTLEQALAAPPLEQAK